MTITRAELLKEYPVNKHNSTVCGYPGRDFDWSKFDWNQETTLNNDLVRIMGHSKIQIQSKAPAVFVDSYLIGEGNEYLHVPYDWTESGTIYRVRPNESMRSGQIYRGHKVIRTKAIKKVDGWYWRLELEA
jgi:hypothetical protein